MVKIIIGLFVGMILMGALFLGPLSQNPVIGKSTGSSQLEVSSDITGIYRDALLSPIKKAGDEIQEDDIARFYHKLIQGYNLDEASLKAVQAEPSSLIRLLPDIKNINQKALSLPLYEAGRNIQDKEIAQFYYKLLKSAGWTVEPD